MSDTQYGGFAVVTSPRVQHTGIVTICEPPHYFQAAFNDPPHYPSTVLVDVVPAQGCTHLILTHGGIHSGLIHSYDTVWTDGLRRLEQLVNSGNPVVRRSQR